MKYDYVFGGLYRCESDWAWNVAGMKDYDVWMVLEGSGYVTVASETKPINRGDCFVFSPDTVLRAWNPPETPLQVVAIHFIPFNKDDAVPFRLHRKIPDPDLLCKLLLKALQHSKSDMEKRNYWLNAALTELEEFDRNSRQPPPGCYDDRISRICENIKQSPEKNWTVPALAAACHLSSDHFYKVFKAFTGVSPGDYVVATRIEQAQHDLLSSSMNISQIAARLGYSSVYFFSRQFKKKCGLSPRSYRNSFTGA